MSVGTVIDPRLNTVEKDYGILVDLKTGSSYYYLKDKNCQYCTQGTPVEFELITIKVPIEGHPLDLDLACAVKVDSDRIDTHKVILELNKISQSKVTLEDNKGNFKDVKSFELMGSNPTESKK